MRKRLWAVLLAFSLMLGMLPGTAWAEDPPTSGECGDNVTWKLDGGTLTISGNGVMYFHSTQYPWFSLKDSIQKVIIENGVTDIAAGAFAGCSKLTNVMIPEGVTAIGTNTFEGCSGLTSISIPDSVTTIGDGAFQLCSGLTSISIPDSVTTIGEFAFSECSGLTCISIPKNVTSIGFGAFNSCSGLTSVSIPDSVTTIGDGAFQLCNGLTSVSIPDSITTIGYDVFFGCSGLTSISIPDSVTTIGYSAFDGCSGLTSVSIPDSVTTIGIYAFGGCSGLTSVSIPDSVTTIGEGAFRFCSGLTGISIPDGVTSIEAATFEDCNGLTSVSIPDSVTTIGESAFWGCSGLTSISIPDSVTSIGNRAFLGCSGLTSLTIPKGVSSINEGAFRECSGLTSVSIPDSVTSIGGGAFWNCGGVKDVNYAGSKAQWEKIAIETANDCLQNATIHYNSTDVPDTPDKPDTPETPSGVCGENVTWKLDGGTLTISGTGVMQDYPPASIPWASWRNSIQNVNIVNGVKGIGNYAFYGCTGLTGVAIPASVTSIGADAFADCSGLTSVTVPASVASIGAGAFSGCGKLSSVTIPDGVTSIENGVFSDCGGLTSITIPKSVTSIGVSAFYNCDGLKNVHFTGTKAQWDTIDIDEADNEALKNADISFDSTGTDTPTPPHTHNWAAVWNSNATHHWHECLADNCNITANSGKNGYGEHVYDNNADTTCNTCGYVRTVTPPTETVKDKLDSILEDTTDSSKIPTAVQETFNRRELMDALMDSGTLTVIEQLETKTAIPVTRNSSVEDFPESQVKITGAALNNRTSDTDAIVLNIGKPEHTHTLSDDFNSRAAIPFSMNLSNVANASSELAVPVRIVLPVPEYISLDRLALLHYESSTKYDTYTNRSSNCTTYTEGGKKYAAVVLDHFSDFVMTELVDNEETYYISIPNLSNGSIVPSTRYAESGERVSLYVHPDKGYELDSLTVKDSRGRTITCRSLGDDGYYFYMPSARVTVDAAFVKTAGDTTATPSTPAGDEPFTGLGTPGISGIVLNPAAMPFTDVKSTDWFYNNVEYVWKHYLMSGVSDTQFAPNTTTNRAMVWTILARMNNVRTDINPGSTWYEKGMLWAKEKGVTDGTDPMGSITREQLATMLWRSAGQLGGTGDLSQFSDSEKVSGYAVTAVRWAVGNGILNGSNGAIDPQGTATRAQIAAMVARYGDKLA